MNNLLCELSEVIALEQEYEKARHESGEDYNVFRIMGVQAKEVFLHSAIITDLLNPRGDHGQGTAFLETFLEMLDGYVDVHFSDLSKVHVEAEHLIGPLSKDGRKGGRIDILINDGCNAIVIENKIHADDQEKQLLRYRNYCREKFQRHSLVYLTLDGTDPSDDSTGGKDIEYTALSYHEDILWWIDRCMGLCGTKITLRETLRQYKTTIEDLTGAMSEESTRKLVELATDDRNISSVLELFNNENEIKTAIRMKFLHDLKAVAEKYGLTCSDDNFRDVARLKPGECMDFVSLDGAGLYCIRIGNETPSRGFWYSISPTTTRKCKVEFIKGLPQIWGVHDSGNKDKENPYGWDFFYGDSGTKDSGGWFNWDRSSTLMDMHNGKMLTFIEREIFRKAAERNLLGILEDNLTRDQDRKL